MGRRLGPSVPRGTAVRPVGPAWVARRAVGSRVGRRSGAGGAEGEDGGEGFVAGGADLVGWEDEADAVFGTELDGEGEGVEVAVEVVGHGAGGGVKVDAGHERVVGFVGGEEGGGDAIADGGEEVAVFGGGGGVAPGVEDELAVGVEVDVEGDALAAGEIAQGGGFGLGEGGGAAVGFGALAGAGAAAAPGDAEVAVEVDAVIAAAIFAPEATAAPGVLVAVGVDDRDDPEIGAVEEAAEGWVAIAVAEEAIGDAGGDHGGDPLARVLSAVDEEWEGGGIADAEGPEGTTFDGAADGGEGGAIGGKLDEVAKVGGDGVVVVVFGEPVGGASGGGVVNACGFGARGGVNVGDEDLPGDAGGVESRERVGGDDNVERKCGAAMLTPDVECEGFDDGAREQSALGADGDANGGCCGRADGDNGGANGEGEARQAEGGHEAKAHDAKAARRGMVAHEMSVEASKRPARHEQV